MSDDKYSKTELNTKINAPPPTPFSGSDRGEGYRPVSLAKIGEDRLQITWNDNRAGTITWAKLREVCPCAACNEDRHRIIKPVSQPTSAGLSLRVLQDKEIPKTAPVKPVSLAPVGNYAYKITWSDGHDTGIFTFEFLHSLCDFSPLPPGERGRG